jgi:hypothetical protein
MYPHVFEASPWSSIGVGVLVGVMAAACVATPFVVAVLIGTVNGTVTSVSITAGVAGMVGLAFAAYFAVEKFNETIVIESYRGVLRPI